jgi:hypothetical protein
MVGECSTYGETRGAYRVLVGKLERKRPLGKRRCSWEYNINVDFQKVEWGARTGFIWLWLGRDGRLL